MINGTDKVISFELLRVERGREKICKCNPPRLVIDEQNRIVTCKSCGATLDGFEALMKLANHLDKIHEYETAMLERTNAHKKLADKDWKRYRMNRVFKEMDEKYHGGLYPYCPKCEQMIDPVKITHWGSKKYYEESEVQE